MSKAAQTRSLILQKASELIYANGFQSTSIDHIISHVQVTKGAFFYHFKNKEEMGLSIVKELLRDGMRRTLAVYLKDAADPLDGIYLMMQFLLIESPLFDVRYGCPAVNLIEEMSPVSPSFHQELNAVITDWQSMLKSSLETGKTSGKVRKDADSASVSYFIIAGYAGIRNLGKIFGKTCYTKYLNELRIYLDNLK